MPGGGSFHGPPTVVIYMSANGCFQRIVARVRGGATAHMVLLTGHYSNLLDLRFSGENL
jgi:hypothetical protein